MLDGDRLHLQHGPIDLIIGADGARDMAFAAAKARFETVLERLVEELPELRAPMRFDITCPRGETARRMDDAVRPFQDVYVTRMAAVAGAVADTVLHAMTQHPIARAFVNNGGDIAVHLKADACFEILVSSQDGHALGRIALTAQDNVGGIATSGRHGRSLSLGIADAVTVLAETAAGADVAATLIANAVDIPHHPAIVRKPANDVVEGSDLGQLPVVIDVGALTDADTNLALNRGAVRAAQMLNAGQIVSAALFLNGASRIIGQSGFADLSLERTIVNA